MLYLQVSTLTFLLWILYWVWKYFTYWILQVLISSLEHLCNIIFYKSHWQDSDFTRFKLLMFNWSLIISYYYYRYYHYYFCHYHYHYYHYYYCYYYNHYCHCHYHYYFTSFNLSFEVLHYIHFTRFQLSFKIYSENTFLVAALWSVRLPL